MSLSYSVEVLLDCRINENTLNEIFKNCERLGFIFYDYELGKSYEEAPVLSHNKALKIVFERMNEAYINGAAWYGVIEGHAMHFWFYQKESHMEVQIGTFSNIRTSTFLYPKDEHAIDFGWYIKLLVDICRNFKIIELHTDTF
jgi:hypothetical protein